MPWACALWGPAAHAQALESALSPGKLAAPHVKWEDECGACHVRFDRAGQDRLCADCHKDVGRDIRQRTGYHGRLPAQACRSCHTDHRGRDARIIALDPKRFDHAQTDYALRGRHAQVPCASCHLPKRQYREAPADCAGCHRKDDPHKGALGAACGDCHGESDWKSGRFDHATTAFSLTGQHTRARRARASPATARTTTARAVITDGSATSARVATARAPGSPRSSSTTPTPASHCAGAIAPPPAPIATPHR
jgi:hypothetical protein